MAGKKDPSNPSRFKKGDPRTIAAAKKGGGWLPQHVKEARKFNAIQFEECLYKYMSLSKEELKQVWNDPKTSARDLAVIKILQKSINEGDYRALDFLLERTIGKVQSNINIKAEVEAKTFTDMVLEASEKVVVDVTPEVKKIESPKGK